jgi:hypothetical protein
LDGQVVEVRGVQSLVGGQWCAAPAVCSRAFLLDVDNRKAPGVRLTWIFSGSTEHDWLHSLVAWLPFVSSPRSYTVANVLSVPHTYRARASVERCAAGLCLKATLLKIL